MYVMHVFILPLTLLSVQAGRSCLHKACKAGSLEVVKYLCERGGEKLLMLTSNVRSSCLFCVCVRVCLSLCEYECVCECVCVCVCVIIGICTWRYKAVGCGHGHGHRVTVMVTQDLFERGRWVSQWCALFNSGVNVLT